MISRRETVEEKRNIKKAYYYVFLSLLALIFLILFGLPILIKFAGFVGDLAKSDKPVEIIDNTPPAPPQFEDIPQYTNNERLEIKGKSENGASIEIFTNNEKSEVVANSNGEFFFTFNLIKGINSISAIATDPSGNKSNETKTFSIEFDNSEPELEIISPKEGDSFYSSAQKQLTIKGSVKEKVDLKINGRFVSVKDDLTFNYTTTLNDGVNSFEVKATDLAGNETLSTLNVNFTP